MNVLEKYRELILKRAELEKQGLTDENLNKEIKDLYIDCINYIEDSIEYEILFL